RSFEPRDHRFARGHAERAAHEVEVLHANHDRNAVKRATTKLHRVEVRGFCAGVFQAVGIAALVAEFQRIERHFGHRYVIPGLISPAWQSSIWIDNCGRAMMRRHYSPALRRAPCTPSASAATRSVTALTVFLLALLFLSRLCLSASTSADPTTTPSAPLAIV